MTKVNRWEIYRFNYCESKPDWTWRQAFPRMEKPYISLVLNLQPPQWGGSLMSQVCCSFKPTNWPQMPHHTGAKLKKTGNVTVHILTCVCVLSRQVNSVHRWEKYWAKRTCNCSCNRMALDWSSAVRWHRPGKRNCNVHTCSSPKSVSFNDGNVALLQEINSVANHCLLGCLSHGCNNNTTNNSNNIFIFWR